MWLVFPLVFVSILIKKCKEEDNNLGFNKLFFMINKSTNL